MSYDWTGGSDELRDWRVPLRHLDRRVGFSLEWRICGMWYFGELTKHLCLQLLCLMSQVPARTVGRRRLDSYTPTPMEFTLERSWDLF